MNRYVADTHALFWYLIGSSRLGGQARSAFDEGARGECLIYLPAIVLAELYYLNEKVGRPLDFFVEYRRLQQSGQFAFIGFLPDDILDFDKDAAVPEMHDRIIAGVARRMNAVCISFDRQIASSGLVTTVW